MTFHEIAKVPNDRRGRVLAVSASGQALREGEATR
jgi:hypothetical protein